MFRMGLMLGGLWVGILLVAGCSEEPHSAGAFYRVVYQDDPILRIDPGLVEEAYGAKIYQVPVSGKPPKTPVSLKGTVLHVALEDQDWVRGERNPMIDFMELKCRISEEFPDIRDISDKWDEYRFLQKTTTTTTPMEMLRGSDFQPAPTQAQRDAIAQRVKETAASLKITQKKILADAVRVEILRGAIEDRLGRSILKIRLANHSEGHLPMTDGDWITLYLKYASETAPRVEAIAKALTGSQDLQDKIVDLPHISGRVLETLLNSPDEVIAQKMMKKGQELRLHVFEGKVIEGATFLRFYHLGEFAAPELIGDMENAIRTDFLDRLPENLKKFDHTSDVAWDEESQRPRIIDFNDGIESGYYWPEEDFITTNLLARAITGASTPVLDRLAAFQQAKLGPAKLGLLKGLLARYRPFLEGDVLEAFWDRVLANYQQVLRSDPTPETLAIILDQFYQAGLKKATIYHQFLSEAQREVKLGPAVALLWKDRLNALDAKLDTHLQDHFLIVTQKGTPSTEDPVASASALAWSTKRKSIFHAPPEIVCPELLSASIRRMSP